MEPSHLAPSPLSVRSISSIPASISMLTDLTGTGNTPLNHVQGILPRDYFWDAPLPLLGSTFSNITASVSPIASTDFVPQFGNIQGGVFNSSQMALLNTQISIANGKGIGVRYWDTPGVSSPVFCFEERSWRIGEMMTKHADTVNSSPSARETESGLRCGMRVSPWSMWMIWLLGLAYRIWATFGRWVLRLSVDRGNDRI